MHKSWQKTIVVETESSYMLQPFDVNVVTHQLSQSGSIRSSLFICAHPVHMQQTNDLLLQNSGVVMWRVE